MNKTAIKNFAIWARRKLISDITYKAGMLGISENGIAQPLQQSTRDLQFFDIGTKDYAEVSGVAIDQRNALIKVIQAKEKSTDYKTAFRNVIEEVAYTWFNRLIAVRFMEVNDYLPSRIRVLSSESEGKLEPDFVTNPFDTDLEFSQFEKDRVFQLKDENKLDELFRMLFIKQCNKLSEILPGLFETISDYTELLLNISFTDKDGIVYHLTHDISEDEFNVEKEGQVEIIGWMYQYYNTEPKDEVFALLKKNVKITKERIPAATQLFTPDWIVRYMVENSLGRLWVEGHPNESLKGNWKYYLEEAEQEPDVIVQLNKIREEYAKINPVDIKVIDPCMGSGHILVYAFDVLMQIYTSQGYVERDAAKSILQNNLFGIDIDVRAYQLAYFAVMMKARQYNRRVFQEHITPNLIAIMNPADVSKSVLKHLGGLESVGLRLVEDFQDAEEYGSILQVNYTDEELSGLKKKLVEIVQDAQYGNLLVQMEAAECVKLVEPLIKQARLLTQKYDVVVTNPPYMTNGSMSDKLSKYVQKKYENTRRDLYAVFIERCLQLSRSNAYQAMITQQTWMFINSYEVLRKKIVEEECLVSLVQLGPHAFDEINGEVVQTTSFIICNTAIPCYMGSYVRLVDFDDSETKKREFENNLASHKYVMKQYSFEYVPKQPIAYWLKENTMRDFSVYHGISEDYFMCYGLLTGHDEGYIFGWSEVSYKDIQFNCKDVDEFNRKRKKYAPLCKGGLYRKWYGNYDLVVRYDETGINGMSQYPKYASNGQQKYFHPGITWAEVCLGRPSMRYMTQGNIFSLKSPSIFDDNHEKLFQLLGFLNTNVATFFVQILNPTISCGTGVIGRLLTKGLSLVNIKTVEECVRLSRDDWDSFETSWDFIRHPLVFDLKIKEEYKDSQWAEDRLSKCSLLSWLYKKWESECNYRFQQLKSYEKELNQVFIDVYGLQNELTSEVADKDITVRRADLSRDIRSLISYAVGCMFGRYSMDVDGLVYAGGDWNSLNYKSFIPDPDNCIPITDEEYFRDDIVGYFVDFIRDAYGADYVEENLDFIAKALGNKGNTSREVIRNYFLNDFYNDHLKVYQKRPIYWLFDSGKQNGFKALVYMHRWNADTVGNLRMEYLHKMQNVYEHELETCQDMIEHGSGHDVAVATKRKEKLVKQLKECKDYDVLVAHIALSKIDIDLDDGVKVNYRKVQTGADGKFCEILANSKDIMAKEK